MVTSETSFIVAAGGVTLTAVWWVVSGMFKMRTRLVKLEGDIALINSEIDNIHTRCHGRETWMREIVATVTRTDKNVVKLAAKMGVEIEE